MEKSQIYEITENRFLPYSDIEGLATLSPCATLTEMWEFCVSRYADRTSVVDSGIEYSYADIDRDVSEFRGALVKVGIERGALVGIKLTNSYAFVKAFLAITTLAATAVLIPVETDREIEEGFIAKTGIKFVVSDGATLPERVIAIDVNEKAEFAPPVAADPSDGCAVVFTGGKSGRQKGAVLSNRAVTRGTLNGCYGYRGLIGARYFSVIPFTHVFGLIRNLLTALYTGSSVYICRQMQSMFREMREAKPTILVLVPALLEAGSRLSRRQGAEYFGGAVKIIICGGAACPPELVKSYADMGIKIYFGYGLTESANLVSGNHMSLEKPTSVGLPFPGQTLKIENGELWIKGDNVFDGYIGGDEENAVAADGWFPTGDLAEFDDDGFLYITGVKKNLIVLPNGEKISPSELIEKFECSKSVTNVSVGTEEIGGVRRLVLECRLADGKYRDDAMNELERINESLPSFKRVNKIIIS